MPASFSWHPLTPAEGLDSVIRWQHCAAQWISRAAVAFLPHLPDDSHTNMGWDSTHSALTGRLLPGVLPVSLQLDTLDLVLRIRDAAGVEQEACWLPEYTDAEARAVLSQILRPLGLNPDLLPDTLHYPLPPLPAEHGVYPEPDPEAARLWAALRHNAHGLIHEVIQAYPQAAAPRIWPHHFDTGSYIPLRDGTRGVGIGLSIPDESSASPYFYVNCWAQEGRPDLSRLGWKGPGQVVSAGWSGLLLPLEDLTALPAAEQASQAAEFLEQGAAALRGVVEAMAQA